MALLVEVLAAFSPCKYAEGQGRGFLLVFTVALMHDSWMCWTHPSVMVFPTKISFPQIPTLQSKEKKFKKIDFKLHLTNTCPRNYPPSGLPTKEVNIHLLFVCTWFLERIWFGKCASVLNQPHFAVGEWERLQAGMVPVSLSQIFCGHWKAPSVKRTK